MRWLLTIEARNADNQPETLRFSDGIYDSPDDHLYLPRIKQPGLYQSGMFAGDIVSVTRSGVGETTLLNTDGKLDYLADYAVDGRLAVLSRTADDQVIEVLRGTVAGLTFDSLQISVRLREPQTLLQLNHPNQTFDGSNVLPEGLEGTQDDIQGQVKPRVYGSVKSAEMDLVNSSKLIYQVSDSTDCFVTQVYDKGAALQRGTDYGSLDELQSVAPDPGYWRAYQGYVRLGASPSGGVTADAESSNTLAGVVFNKIAEERGFSLPPDDIAVLNDCGSVGLYIKNTTSTTDLLDRIIVSVGGYWRIASSGQIRANLLSAPSNPTLTLEPHQVQTVSRSATGAGSNSLPVWRVKVKADRIETVQTDLAGNVEDSRRSRLANEYREVVAEDFSTLDRHPLSSEMEIITVLRSLQDAQRLADRVATLVSVRRDRVTLDAKLTKFQTPDIGQTIVVKTSHLGYSAGREMLVIGKRLDAQAGKYTLELWG